VKYLLIILSILLLSSPLFGQETGVLYQYETSSGLVWKSVGSKKLQPKYEGQVENRIPNGQGTFTSSDGRKYVGEFKDGKRNGQGTYTWSDGRKYVGELKDGQKHGQGTFTFPNGNKGIGEFRENKPLNITEYDKYGNIIGKFVNGVKQ